MPKSLSPDKIDFLLERKFPHYRMLQRQLYLEVVPNKNHEKSRKEILAYEMQLFKLPFEESQALYEREHAKHRQDVQANIEHRERQRFFSMPNANADFTHWGKAAHWTLDEATALSFGKAPEVVNWASVKDLVDLSPFATQYARVLDLAHRAKEQQELHDPVVPSLFLAWAKRNEFDYPPELEEQVNARGQLALQSTKEKPLGTKERQSALKLIIGLAIGGYGYDPSERRSSKVSDINDDLARHGLSLDPDTVRKWLRQAAEVLPPKNSDDQDR